MRIYFAGSIRGGREDAARYEEIITLLQRHGTVLTEHVGSATLSALGEDGPTDAYIYDRDMAWLREADVVVADVTVPSLGVGYELAKAEEWKKKTLCIFRPSSGRRVSAMIAGAGCFPLLPYEQISDLQNIFTHFFRP